MITPLDILSLETWILIITSLILIRLYIHKKWQVLRNLNIPHDPPTLMGMGNLMPLMKNPDLMFDGHAIFKKKFGPIYGSYQFLTPTITITDTEIIKQVFIKEFSNFPDRQKILKRSMGKEMNTGLTAVTGDQWKRIRNTLSPTFSSSKLKQMSGILEECADTFVRNIGTINSDEKGRFDASMVFGKLSLDSICSSALGVKVDSQSKPSGKEPKIVQMAKGLSNFEFTKNPLLLVFMVFPWTEWIAEKFNYSLFPAKYLNYFYKLIDAVIEEKKSQPVHSDMLQNVIDSEITENEVNAGATKGMTRVEIKGNSLIFIFGGYENTSNAMLFLAYNLALNKDAQQRAREEAQAAIDKHGGLTYEAIQSLKYMTQCLNESIRLYPLTPMNTRYSEQDMTINGITIPKGVQVLVPTFGMMRDEEYWEDPLTFNPDRMEDMSKVDPMIYQPFGAGPRNCIGMKFALLEIKITFAKLLLKYDLDVCDDTPKHPLAVAFKTSVKPKETLFLKVVERKEVPAVA